MCGFFGALGKDKINLEKYKFHSYRGPDDYNEVYLFDSINKNFAINHSRLEIIGDKIAGKQPVINNNICFAFNGEIFGQELIDYKNSDTLFLFNKFDETIKDNNKLKLNSFLNSLNGFFAIAILDRINSQILLIRDRYGQKPLYYAKKSQKFCFGSCIKDIRNYLDINIKTNKVNIRRGGGFIYDELNPVDSSYIKQVAPGEIVRYKDGKIQNEFWSEIDNKNLYKGENYSEYLERLDYLLDDAVKIRCHSPKKIALSLSGGYDSSLIAHYASKYKPDLQAFTLSVNDEKFNEVSRAKLISEKLNIPLI